MTKAEKFIQDYTSNCYNYNSYAQDPIPWLTSDQAKRAVEIAREEIIEWIEDNIEQYPIDNWDRFVNSLITDLKQAMKDE